MSNTPIYWTQHSQETMEFLEQIKDRVFKAQMELIPTQESHEHWVIDLWLMTRRPTE